MHGSHLSNRTHTLERQNWTGSHIHLLRALRIEEKPSPAIVTLNLDDPTRVQ